MRIVLDPDASGSAYVDSTVSGQTVPASGGTAVCTFRVDTAGRYRVHVRRKAPNANADSMYASINGEAVTSSTHIFDMGESKDCTTGNYEHFWENVDGFHFVWSSLKDRAQNCAGLSGSAGVGYERSQVSGGSVGVDLTAGNNTITFYGREIGAGVDKVTVTSNLSYDPNDIVSPVRPTPRIGTKPIRVRQVPAPTVTP